SAIPVAGKTGTAQGAGNYPWNDSSAFAAYSVDDDHPFTVSAYLEKSGYGSQAAGPVVKCVFLQLSGIAPADPVVLSDPLDTENLVPAEPKNLADQSCYDGRFSAQRTTE
ncbi:MAG: penicillin-binding protein 2, partial [Candidatus Aldehydirespiratoraceae bacterium]